MTSKTNFIEKEKKFKFNGKEYIARLYKPHGRNQIYGEIVYATSNERVPNMKGLTREFLKPHGIEIPTDANTIQTHKAVKILIDVLEEKEVKQK